MKKTGKSPAFTGETGDRFYPLPKIRRRFLQETTASANTTSTGTAAPAVVMQGQYARRSRNLAVAAGIVLPCMSRADRHEPFDLPTCSVFLLADRLGMGPAAKECDGLFRR
jgi:hypothetical protein